MMKKIYKCRLCQKIINEVLTDELKANIEFSNLSEVELIKRHYCEESGLGIADLIGYVNCLE